MATLAEQISALEAKVTGFFTGSAKLQEQLDAALARAGLAEGNLAKANEKITGLEAQVATLTAERDQAVTAKEEAIKARDEAETKSKETEASVDVRSNQKALAIEQKRGVTTPVKDETGNEGGGTEATESKRDQYMKITDAKARAEFYAKHADEIYAGK
jgi:chromosome segregation ATPase